MPTWFSRLWAELAIEPEREEEPQSARYPPSTGKVTPVM
jgi:hypothetical protein